MFRNSLSNHLAVLSAVCLFAVGCGDDSSGHRGDSSSGAAGEAGESNAGAAGACEAGGCRADEGGAGGEGGTREGDGGEGGGSMCDPNAVLSSPATNARRARSAGFQGSSQAYLRLFDVPCSTATDCASACADAGGQKLMCDAAECLPNVQAGNGCAPAPVWDNLAGIQAEASSTADMCQLILVNTTYRDALLTDQFKLEIPKAATVRGITVDIRRAGDDSVSDDSVRIIKGGKIGAAERALPQTWSADVGWVSYGGPTDLWGEQWSAADVNSDDFGVALSVAYGKNVGNTLAYVDEVRVTITYQVSCD